MGADGLIRQAKQKGMPPMALSDVTIRALRAGYSPFKESDSKGLYLEVFPKGSKLWRQKFRFAGKVGRLALGASPEVSLAEARRRRDEAREQIAKAVCPD